MTSFILLTIEQIIQQIKQRMKKQKLGPNSVQTVISREPALASLGGLAALGGRGEQAGGAGGGGGHLNLNIADSQHGAQRDADKKIIIEDFVEVKRLTASTEPPAPAPKVGLLSIQGGEKFKVESVRAILRDSHKIYLNTMFCFSCHLDDEFRDTLYMDLNVILTVTCT